MQCGNLGRNQLVMERTKYFGSWNDSKSSYAWCSHWILNCMHFLEHFFIVVVEGWDDWCECLYLQVAIIARSNLDLLWAGLIFCFCRRRRNWRMLLTLWRYMRLPKKDAVIRSRSSISGFSSLDWVRICLESEWCSPQLTKGVQHQPWLICKIAKRISSTFQTTPQRCK